MGLRFDPVGGGQFKQAIQKIIEAESQPITSLNARKGKEEARMKLFQEFKGKFNGFDKTLTDLSTFHKFRELKVDLGDGEKLASVTVDKETAEPGRYELKVNQLAKRTSLISTGLESPDDPLLGSGYMTLNLENGESTDVYIDEANASLHGVAKLINQTPGSSLKAAVVKDDSEDENPWKLILSSTKEGEKNQLETPDYYFFGGWDGFAIDDDIEAENASISINGFDIELASNDTQDFLPGVNLHLKQADGDHPFTLTITEDTQKISAKVKTAVDQLNGILKFIVDQNTVDGTSDTSSNFTGDSTLRTLENQLRSLVHQGYGVTEPGTDNAYAVYISQIGIEFDKHGQLQFNEDKFKKILESDFDRIARAISGPNGFANTAHSFIFAYTRPLDGILVYKEGGIKNRIHDIDNQIERKNRLIEQKKQALTDQFARLESTIGAMQRQQQYLSSVLPAAGGGNSISQLLGG